MITCFGEIMMRLSPPDNLKISQADCLEMKFGGSEANVAVSLSRLGMTAQYVTRVPDTDIGKTALYELNKWGVTTNNCLFGGERLGLYFLEHGAGYRASKVMYDRSHSGMATLEKGMIDWKKTLQETKWLHWSGITPAISQSAADATLEAVSMAKIMGVTVSCDLNYRANLWQYGKRPADIMPELLPYCDVVLGDGFAFEHYFGINGLSEEDFLRQLFGMFPQLKYAAMTSRQGFSASHNAYKGYLFDGHQFIDSKTYDIPDIIDRIGAGDAFMSGLVYGILQYSEHLTKVVEFATAAATLKHYIKGDFNLSTPEEVEALMSGNTGGKVNR